MSKPNFYQSWTKITTVVLTKKKNITYLRLPPTLYESDHLQLVVFFQNRPKMAQKINQISVHNLKIGNNIYR